LLTRGARRGGLEWLRLFTGAVPISPEGEALTMPARANQLANKLHDTTQSANANHAPVNRATNKAKS
jgi:hypothetical protein